MSYNKQILKRRPDKADKQPKLHEALLCHEECSIPANMSSPFEPIKDSEIDCYADDSIYFNDCFYWHPDWWDDIFPSHDDYIKYYGLACPKCRSNSIKDMQWQYSNVTLKGKLCGDCDHEFASIVQQDHNQEESKKFMKERLDTESISHYSRLNYDYYAYEDY